jgi:hypothetical protein
MSVAAETQQRIFQMNRVAADVVGADQPNQVQPGISSAMNPPLILFFLDPVSCYDAAPSAPGKKYA